MSKAIIINFGLFLLLLSSHTVAQLRGTVQHYSTEDGLSHNRIMCMLRDHDGFMWFGTWDGLNRFDGHKFVVYKSRPGDLSSLGSSRIEAMIEDNSGNLWLRAYDNRIYRFNKKTQQFFYLDLIPKNTNGRLGPPVFDKILLIGDNHICITTKRHGVFIVSNLTAQEPEALHLSASSIKPLRLASNDIRGAFKDLGSNLWLITDKGVCSINFSKTNTASQKVMVEKKIPGAFISIADDRQYLYLGTATGRLLRLEKRTGSVISKEISKNALTSILCSKNNRNLFITTIKAEVITATRDLELIRTEQMFQSGAFFSSYEDSRGYLWLQAKNYGVVRYSPFVGKFSTFEQRSDAYFDREKNFFKVFEDPYGLVWVSMRSGGFGYFDEPNNKIAYFYNEPGGSNTFFSNLTILSYLDPLGNLWIHADDKGLNKIIFARNKFDTKTLVQNTINRSQNEIRGIFNDNRNRLWLASKAGELYVIKDGIRQNIEFTNIPVQGIGIIYSIIQDNQGRMWFGTRGDGLFRADPLNETQTRFALKQYKTDDLNKFSLSSNNIYALYKDKRNNIWVGTYGGGVNIVDDSTGQTRFINKNNSAGLLFNERFLKVRHLNEDFDRNIWVATTDGLLILSRNVAAPDKIATKFYQKIPGDSLSLSKSDIQYIFRDSKNKMWLATSGGGLNEAIGSKPLTKLQFRSYTIKDGFPSDYIVGCVQDESNFLWLATENGLSKFNMHSHKISNYDYYDGLPKSGFSEASCLKLPSGKLVFGTLSGYVSFFPRDITNVKISSKLVFTNLLINNSEARIDGKILFKDINETQAIKVKYDENTISLDYNVLDYRPGNKQSYAYRLLGYDSTWRDNKNERRVTYTNLPPGSYDLQIKSLNTEAYTFPPRKNIKIKILPPFYLTWWAYLIYLILLVVFFEVIRRIVITMIRLRQRIVVGQKMADLKINFFTKVSHELRTPLTLILNPIEEIRKDSSLSILNRQHADLVKKNADRLLKFINQLLDHSKLENGQAKLEQSSFYIIGFLKGVCSYFMDISLEKNIELVLKETQEDFLVCLDIEKLDVVIYNVLANAFKFTGRDKRISISVTRNNDQFTIEIADQGGGVPEASLKEIFELYYVGEQETKAAVKGTGIGLALSKELTEIQSGSIMAYNNEQNGLTVCIKLPIGMPLPTSRVEVAQNIQVLPGYTIDGSGAPTPFQVKDITVSGTDPLLLLVEDSGELRNFLANQLKAHYRVEVAANGEEGLRIAIDKLPDIILSDVMMPVMDGIEMLDNLKSNVLTSHIPVVLLTARSSVEHQLEGIKYGADYYLTKPFNNDLLLACMESLIGQRQKLMQRFLSTNKSLSIGPSQIIITDIDESFLLKVVDFLEERMGESDFNIENIAESMNMGRSTFYKKLKSLTTLNPVEFVTEIRLKRAQQYLESGTYTIAEIAYKVGFKNAKYFSTCFKEKYKISPSEYQRRHKGDLRSEK
ncbi:two-component regulator propeller domain-containing protein [Pedobacter aquatilis]|uniref:hybrid sensor histidine kinase/response regulator transcription factor n=1 Tax=Pedobacter aquatilis TaxID=351343 RepID=UPI00292E793B|nr:two-component regulator propeller domain-containing protein [Pedobacter aquatilis]